MARPVVDLDAVVFIFAMLYQEATSDNDNGAQEDGNRVNGRRKTGVVAKPKGDKYRLGGRKN